MKQIRTNTAKAIAFGKSLTWGILCALAFGLLTPLTSRGMDIGGIYTSDFYFYRVYMTWDSSHDVIVSIVKDWRGKRQSEGGKVILAGSTRRWNPDTQKTEEFEPQWYPQGWAGYRYNLRGNDTYGGGRYVSEESRQTEAVDYDHTVLSRVYLGDLTPDIEDYALTLEMDVYPLNTSRSTIVSKLKKVRFGSIGRVKLAIPDGHSAGTVRAWAETWVHYWRNVAGVFWDKFSSLWA